MTMRAAFTLLELLVVIVILALLAAVGFRIFSPLVTAYTTAASFEKQQASLNNAVLVAQARLNNAILPTLAAFSGSFGGVEVKSGELNSNLTALNLKEFHNQVCPLQEGCGAGVVWFAKSYETLRNNGSFGWSGFVSFQTLSRNKSELAFSELSGDLKASQEVLKSLFDDRKQRQMALIFLADDESELAESGGEKEDLKELYKSNSTLALKTKLKPPKLVVSSKQEVRVWERYALSHTLNALALQNGELVLYYDFLPWETSRAKRAVLLDGVESFEVKRVGKMGVLLTICVRQNGGKVCKNTVTI